MNISSVMCFIIALQNLKDSRHIRMFIQTRNLTHVCGYSARQKGNINRHQWIHFQERNSTSVVYLTIALRTIHFSKLIQGDIQDKFHRKSLSIYGHQQVFSGKEPYDCEVCGYNDTTVIGLEKHLKIHTGDWIFFIFLI